MVKLKFPDGSVHQVVDGVTAIDVIKEKIGEGLARVALAAKINDKVVDLTTPITTDGDFKVLTFKDAEGKEVFKHSAAHILAIAVTRLFPKAKLTIGPSVEDGFYYDIDNEEPFTTADLEKIEAEIKKIVKENIPFKREEISKESALKIFKDNEFKTEMINDLGDEQLTVYKNGEEFLDLCRGPHVTSTGKVKAMKLLKVSGAFWRGDAKNKQLQRIYGVAFPNKDELKEYLHILEEAQKRDHRKIGKNMGLFSFHEEGPGFPFWHNKGMILKNLLVDYWREEHSKENYEEVQTPIMLNRTLWETSGHWDLYKENMYTTKIDEQDFAIKPMNCPGGMLIYKEDVHSYRELPMKVGELGLVHRHEASGALSGLFRVRTFTQDDAHVFCSKDQLKDEVKQIINLIKKMLGIFGFKELKFTLSVRSEKKKEKYLGSDEQWSAAEGALTDALNDLGINFIVEEGEAKFYGPSLDVQIRDALKREWQCSTIQLDFNLAKRFDITYIDEDGNKATPYILHRVVYGSLERFIGVITEEFAGKFPLWLAPVQVKLLPIADRHQDYCKNLKTEFAKVGIRAEVNEKAETTNKKVREAQLENVPLMLIVGDKEIENKTLAVRTLNGKQKFGVSMDDFKAKISENVSNKELKFEL